MKLTLSKETLRKLAVKSAVRAGQVNVGGTFVNCPPVANFDLGPGVSRGNPCWNALQNELGNPDLPQQVANGLSP